MLASNKVMDALKSIGLNLYERKIWVALLSKGTATVGELAELSNVPRSRAYDILESLAAKGFVVLQPSKPLKAVAIPPEEALERAKKKLEVDFKTAVERIDGIKNSTIMRELKDIYEKGLEVVQPEDLTGALKGKYSVFQQMEAMFRNANKHISIVTTPEGLNELTKHHLGILKRAKEKGVNIRIATVVNEKSSSAVKALSGIAEIRNLNQKEIPINGRFAIVDGKELVLNLADSKSVDPSQELAIWTKSSHVSANVLGPLFNLIWKNSKPVS